jgi:hypothetical protein
MLIAALKVKHGPRASLIAAHIGFIILNMATMPHWMIEGDILYGIICGYTFYYRLRPAEARVSLRGRSIMQRGPSQVPAGSAARSQSSAAQA